jgi:DNA helicase-2/ATP-dependent DNA helicase PcrA
MLTRISWFKQNALTPTELRTILQDNQRTMEACRKQLAKAFATTPAPKFLGLYGDLLASLQKHATNDKLFGFPSFAQAAASSLALAIAEVPLNGRYAKSITAWRSMWCIKDSDGAHIFKDDGRNAQKMQALVHIYEALLTSMAEQGLYDFDDMIIEVVQAMERSSELRLNLQERYQYVLVDEFQDTNKAQLRMLHALGDNPIFEQRPNIMAVGDDDQAIYAFQGAEVSNMVAFSQTYRQPTLITLQDNYRSTAEILGGVQAIADQISDRLTTVLPDSHHTLVSHTQQQAAVLRHDVFMSELSQYDWVAEQIEQYIQRGTAADQIAILAPRHRYLERMMPYLGARHIPVAYERRENILESPIVLQLLGMAQLVVAINENRQVDVDNLLGQVLRYEFWQISSQDLVELSLTCYSQRQHWIEIALQQQGKIQDITTWFIRLAARSILEPLEYVIDACMGGIMDGVDSEYDELANLSNPSEQQAEFVSPLRVFYFSQIHYEQATDSYLALLGQLSTLRQRLREWRPNQTLYIKDFVAFAELHTAANIKVVDTNPHTQTTNAVQVMTAYKAKGLEFAVVFVINAQDEVWGPTARSKSPSIVLPKNLPIAPAQDGDNDKLRLLFVALSRAKYMLHITGYSHTLENKLSPSLSFIQEQASPAFVAHENEKILSTDWAYRFRQVLADKPTLFEPILANYKLSVTHLNNFIDVTDAGPQYFLLHNLLRFPQAPTPAAAYGDAVHKTLQWYYAHYKATQKQPTIDSTLEYFEDAMLRKHVRVGDLQKLTKRGTTALRQYFAARAKDIDVSDSIERNFNNEGVIVATAHLSGKIDKLQFVGSDQATVIDYKTGKPAATWQGKDEYEKIKLYKYRQQLLFYKLLVEHSATFSNKRTVTNGGLEFIEANERQQLLPNLMLTFDIDELQRFTVLIGKVWEHIMRLDFPDVSKYAQTLKGIQQFEQDLIDDIV